MATNAHCLNAISQTKRKYARKIGDDASTTNDIDIVIEIENLHRHINAHTDHTQ